MRTDVLERAVLDGIISDLEADGFKVIRDPRQPILPAFMGSYQPDLIALGPHKNIAVEIKSPSGRAEKDISSIANLFEGRPDWEFKVYWMSERSPERSLRAQAIDDIDRVLNQVESLANTNDQTAGFLLAWAAFEALGRKLLTSHFSKPQSPGRLIEVMANEGVLTPDEASLIRHLVPQRNSLIHGELDTKIPVEMLGEFVKILKNLSSTVHESV